MKKLYCIMPSPFPPEESRSETFHPIYRTGFQDVAIVEAYDPDEAVKIALEKGHFSAGGEFMIWTCTTVGTEVIVRDRV